MLKVHEGVGGPEGLAQLLPADQFAGVLQQNYEDLKGLLGQAETDTLLPKFLRREVCFKWAEGDERAQLLTSRYPLS